MEMSLVATTIGRLFALAGATALGSALVTRAYIALARWKKFAAPPDPWHDQPVAQAGGVAVWLVIAVAALLLGLHRRPAGRSGALSGPARRWRRLRRRPGGRCSPTPSCWRSSPLALRWSP